MPELTERVEQFIRRHDLLTPGEHVLLAVSGGADSVAMLLILANLARPENLGLKLRVAHLDHGIRGSDAQADADFVAELAEKLALPCHLESLDVPDLARKRGVSLEVAGRQARHEFFARLAKAHHCTAVALAHHADDQAETVLQRIIRGTGLPGLAGIRSQRLLSKQPPIRIVRPLLCCRRQQIEQFLSQRSADWRMDHTNLQSDFTRNWIRNELLLQLRQRLNPRVDDALLRLAELAADATNLIERQATEFLRVSSHALGLMVCIDLQALQQIHRALQGEVVRLAWAGLGLPQRDMNLEIIQEVLARVQEHLSQGKPDRLTLPGGGEAICQFGKLLLATENSPTSFESVELSLPGQAHLEPLALTVRLDLVAEDVQPSDRMCPDDRTVELIDRDCISGRLVIRSPLTDEVFEPLGGSGSEQIGQFLLNCRVPRLLHPLTPVLSDDKGVLWVVAHRLAQRARLTSQSSDVIELSVGGDRPWNALLP